MNILCWVTAAYLTGVLSVLSFAWFTRDAQSSWDAHTWSVVFDRLSASGVFSRTETGSSVAYINKKRDCLFTIRK